jgi:hypothetical protein
VSLIHFKCTVSVIVCSENLGFWGHGIRNKYQNNLCGDFIINADDDDIFTPDAFELIRKHAVDSTKLYIFKEATPFGTTVWQNEWLGSGKPMAVGAISTVCGVIPNIKILPDWGLFYGGDGQFYVDITSTLFPEYELVDEIISIRGKK